MIRIYFLIMPLLAASVLLCLDAGLLLAGQLAGSAEWRYGQYRAEEDGRTVEEASYRTQQYSLLYQTGGAINHGRGGKYDLGFGLEWTAINSEVNGQERELEAAKVLYNGRFLLAPGGLPFRLEIFSSDLHKTVLMEDGGVSTGTGRILDPNIITNLLNGQHVRSGATLIVGIKNGHYLGKYRDLLSRYPRLLFDYQENFVRDLKSRTPQHYRERNLAFVSLNKKDNWFHYRFLDFEDFEDPTNDFTEKVYMLGSVDHTMRRQWINLTNWIRVSADGAFTTTAQANLGEVPTSRYDLNLFATARRRGWDASTFTNFIRKVDGDGMDKSLEVPFYLKGEISPDTAYRFRFVGTQEREDRFAGGIRIDESDLFVSTRLEALRRSPYKFDSEFEAEVKGGGRGEGNAVRISGEFYSNRALRRPAGKATDLLASYSLAHLAGTGESGTDVDFWEHVAIGSLARAFGSRVRSGIEEKVIYGTGVLDRTVSTHVTPVSDDGLAASPSTITTPEGEVLRSTTTWFGEFSARTLRLANRLELVYDIRTDDDGSDSQFIASHTLRYDRRSFLAKMRNELTMGSGLSASSLGGGDLDGSAVGSVDSRYSHNTTLRYSPGRAWEASLSVDYIRQNGDAGISSKVDVLQEYAYNLYTVNGIHRKVAELGEELGYERTLDFSGVPRSLTTLTLWGDYYPTKTTLLGARVRYHRYSPDITDEVACFLTAGLNYEKLQVSLDYGYGTRIAEANPEKRNEQSVEVKVKKVF
jgi:hypothetical protein